MSFIKEFKEFAARGNVVDLAVAVVIGAAFGRVVTSFVNDIIMPPIGMALGGVDFKDLAYVLRDAYLSEGGEEMAPVTLSYGNFIQNVIDFTIIAFVIFMVIRGINHMKNRKKVEVTVTPVAPPTPPKSEVLLEEIRDLLKKQ